MENRDTSGRPPMKHDLHRRDEYDTGSLDESSIDPDPLVQLRHWLDEAAAAGVPEWNAMALSTVGPEGRPSSRNLLLRGIDPQGGLVMFTNYNSRKGRELDAHPDACLLFSWLGLHRQVRVEGRVERTSDAVSDEYFASRPAGSRIGAWASPQSAVLEGGRVELEQLVEQATQRFEGAGIPRPEGWGGYRLQPDRVEFWQGRPSRLHDRLEYRWSSTGWQVVRLAP